MTTAERIEALGEYGADLRDAMERFSDDEELYLECIQLFLDDGNMEALGPALAAGDAVKAFQAAHAIKGVAANLALQPLHDAVAGIVEPLRAGRAEAFTEQYAALRTQYDRLAALMSGYPGG